MIGTVAQDSSHTTPDPLQLQESLRAMVDAGVTHCFMEVSSHGIAQKRIEGLTFAGGVFTNLSHDHLDFHKTFAQYRDVKKEFLISSPKKTCFGNADDKNAAYMLQNCSETYKIRFKNSGRLSCQDLKISLRECCCLANRSLDAIGRDLQRFQFVGCWCGKNWVFLQRYCFHK